MRSLIKYELKRDRFKALIVILGVIICTYLVVPSIFPADSGNSLLGIQGLIILGGFLVVIDMRITHLAKDTLFENREHMMLIPKSILQIVGANAIVAYIDCLIFTGILMSVLNVDFSIKLLRGLVLVNLAFIFYVLFTCLYLLSGKIIKKPIFAAIGGITTTIVVIILSITSGAVHLYFTRIEIATLLIGLLAILGIFAIAASLGHKFHMRKKETKVMIIIGVLCIASLGLLTHAYVNRAIENTDLTFIMDNQIVGKWETVDYVSSYEGYIPREVEDDFSFEFLTFNEGGTIEERKESKWTKGYIIQFPLKNTKSQYYVREINGDSYLFAEWKSGDYVYRHMRPRYYVLKKVN